MISCDEVDFKNLPEHSETWMEPIPAVVLPDGHCLHEDCLFSS